MNRIMLLVGCVALLTSCCMAKTDKPAVRCTLYQDGKAVELVDADSLAVISLRLLENCDDHLLLIVTPDLIDSLKKDSIALETVFPGAVTVQTRFGYKQKITKILIPLSGDYGPSEDLSSAVIFSGEKGYGTAPCVNSQSNADLLKLKSLLKL